MKPVMTLENMAEGMKMVQGAQGRKARKMKKTTMEKMKKMARLEVLWHTMSLYWRDVQVRRSSCVATSLNALILYSRSSSATGQTTGSE